MDALTRRRLVRIAGALLESVQAEDTITVYHGTPLFVLPKLINGFDANTVHKRQYNGPSHKGLFVTPSLSLAKSFGGGAVLALQVKAKHLFGTDYSGNTGRDQEKSGKDLSWIREKYPESFRPMLTYTFNQSAEPQALLRGLISPKQIVRLWVKRYDGNQSWEEFTREEFLKRKEVSNVEHGRKSFFENAGIDLSSPNLKLKEFVQLYCTFHGRPQSAERTLKKLVLLGSRNPERLKEMFGNLTFGGSALGATAVENLSRQVMELVHT